MDKVKLYKSVRFLIPFILCIAILIPLFVLIYIDYNSIKNMSIEKNEAGVRNELMNKSLSVDFILDEVSQSARLQSDSFEFQNYISDYWNAPESEKETNRAFLTTFMQQSISNVPSIESSYLYIEGSSVIFSSDQKKREIPVSSIFGNRLMKCFSGNMNSFVWISDFVNDKGSNGILYLRPLYIKNLPACAIAFEIKTENLRDLLYNRIFPDSCLMICDKQGNIMLQSGVDEIYPLLENIDNISEDNNLKYFIDFPRSRGPIMFEHDNVKLIAENYSSTTAKIPGWHYIEIITLHSMNVISAIDIVRLVLSLILSVLAALLGSIITSKIVIRPIDRVLDAMKETEKGSFKYIDLPIPENELGTLMNGYNVMTKNLENLIEKEYKQELTKRDSELRLIHSQLDEHFLYNTLNTIQSVLKQGDQKLASEMIMMLSRLFRLNLSEGREYISVSDVRELIQCYLMIQKTRFGDRIKIHIDYDDTLDEYYVVKYLFQPIVENAFKHGLEEKSEGGRLDLRFQYRDHLLYFECSDNGIGMDIDEIEAIQKEIKNYSGHTNGSFALKTINEQMRLAYGKQYQLNIESVKNEGTKVFFSIPLREDDPDGK